MVCDTSRRGTTGREGTRDRVKIGLRGVRASRSRGGRGLEGSVVGSGKGAVLGLPLGANLNSCIEHFPSLILRVRG